MDPKKFFQWPSMSDIVLYGAPVVFLPIPIFVPGKEAIAAYVILWVAAYWASGCLSLGVTALVPVVVFSFFEVVTVIEITHAFFFRGLWLFFGSLMLAIAAETSKLHLRIALKSLLFFGTQPRRLLFGFMTTTFVMSMWIPNLVVTAILLPITQGVLEELKGCAAPKNQETEELNLMNFSDRTVPQNTFEENSNGTDTSNHVETNGDSPLQVTDTQNKVISDKMMVALSKSITICIPYSASIGGVATITGTLTNLIGIVFLKTIFPDSSQISFGTWFLYCAPAAVCSYLVSYVWIAWFYFGIDHPRTWFRKKSQSAVSDVDHLLLKRVLEKQYNKLGKIRWDEMWVLVVFAVTVLLWFTRKPGVVPGWSVFFNERYVNDGTVAMTTALLLFLVPKEKPVFFSSTQSNSRKSCPKILSWRAVQENLMWEIIFVIGGSLLLATGAQKSGLMALVAENLKFFANFPGWLVCLCLASFCMVITEFIGNVAATNLLLPIFVQIAVSIGVHPYYICVPVILANSLSFMLPVATLPNAMAYGTGLLETWDMIKTGSMLNIIGLFFIYLSINTYGRFMFGLDAFPVWADIHGNGTVNTSDVLSTTVAP